MNREEILRGENIKVKIGDKEIIKNLNINIEKGKIFSIIGPNGSGKTTLLRALSRDIKVASGEVYLEGKSIGSMKQKEIARKMAVVSQSYVCPSDIKVKELIMYGRFSHKKWLKGITEEDNDIVSWALKRTSMTKFANRKMQTLSGGERQRAWIAMAIAQKPDILLLDEPTTYLDISHQIELLDLVSSLNKEEGITIVMVLHDINQAARYSDQLLVMKDGELIHSGTSKNIVNEEMLRKIFSIQADIFTHDESKRPFFYANSVFKGETI